MATARDILIIVRLQDEATRGLRSLSRELDGLGSTVGTVATAAVAVAAAVGSAAVAVGTLGVSFDAMREQAEIGLGFVIQDADRAKGMVEELVRFASNNPIPVQPLIEAARFMAGVGVEASHIVPILATVADATAALGGSEAVFNRIAYAIQQVIAKGRLQAEEVRQLANAGVPALQILAEKSGQTQRQILADMKSGSLSIDSVSMLLDGIRERFAGALAAQADTLKGMIVQIRNYIQTWSGVASMPVFEELKRQAREVLALMRSPEWASSAQAAGDAVANFLARFNFSEILRGIGQLVVAFGRGVAEIAGWLDWLIQQYEGHTTATELALASLVLLWIAIWGPAGPILLTLGAVIVFLGAWEGDWADFFSKLPDPVADAAIAIVNIVGKMVDGIAKVFELNKDIWASFFDVVGMFAGIPDAGAGLRARKVNFSSETVLGGTLSDINAARDAAAIASSQRRFAVPEPPPGTWSPGDDPNRWKPLFEGLGDLGDAVGETARAAKAAAKEHEEYLKLVEQTNKDAIKASAWLAEQTFAAAEAMEKAKQKIEGFFLGELQRLAGQNVRFAPGVFEQYASQAGLRPIGDFPAWADGKQVNPAFDDQGNKITVTLSPDLAIEGVP